MVPSLLIFFLFLSSLSTSRQPHVVKVQGPETSIEAVEKLD